MKKGEISNETFDNLEGKEFSDRNYILVTRDKNFNQNILPIIYIKNGKILDIDGYYIGDKIWTTPNNKYPDELPLMSKFEVDQILKLSSGTIVTNTKHIDRNDFPKTKTYWTNLSEIEHNEIVEIFEGEINEETSTFITDNEDIYEIIRSIYIPSNLPFFILEKKCLKGPFKVLRVNSLGNFIIEKSSWRSFGIYEFNEDVFVEFETNDILRRIIIPGIIEPKLIKNIDFVSDFELIERFRNQIESNPNDFDQITLNKLLEFSRRAKLMKSFEGYEEYEKRFIEILRKFENEALFNLNISKLLPELEKIKTEKELLEKQKFEIKNEHSKLQDSIIELEKNKEDLKEQINNLSHKKEEANKALKENLENEIKELEERKTKIDEEINKDKESKSNELHDLEANIRYQEDKKKSLIDGIKILQDEFSIEQGKAHKNLKDLLLQNQHYNILSGREFKDSDIIKKIELIDFQIKNPTIIGNENKLTRYVEFKKQLTDLLEKNNRKLESHFIDNILISIHQNTLTLFAGLPGTGKTTLVRLLTNILAPKERIREISVGRGWSSQKDLIGFFNPLSKSFHSSPTNLYSLLKQLDWERKQNIYLNSPFSYVLLDEANLSPMEHYWSVFYNLTDSICKENSYLKINLGDTEIIEYANNLRFIGTINYDQTTEELSPRVIDRANIIRMHPKSFEIDKITSNEIENLKLSYQECIEFFDIIDFSTKDKSIQFETETERKFNEIKKKFEELKIFISPRVQISIIRYCSVAKDFMYEENKPLDYCIAQRLLPLIRVQGKKAKSKLEELLGILKTNKFDISSKILEDIINAGSEGEIFQDSFNYFLTLSHV